MHCAGVLEQVLTAVEEGKTAVNLDQSLDYVDHRVSQSVILPSSKARPAPRYLGSDYMSKRTKQRLEREAAEKAAQEAPVDKETQKRRQQ